MPCLFRNLTRKVYMPVRPLLFWTFLISIRQFWAFVSFVLLLCLSTFVSTEQFLLTCLFNGGYCRAHRAAFVNCFWLFPCVGVFFQFPHYVLDGRLQMNWYRFIFLNSILVHCLVLCLLLFFYRFVFSKLFIDLPCDSVSYLSVYRALRIVYVVDDRSCWLSTIRGLFPSFPSSRILEKSLRFLLLSITPVAALCYLVQHLLSFYLRICFVVVRVQVVYSFHFFGVVFLNTWFQEDIHWWPVYITNLTGLLFSNSVAV